MSAIIAVRVSDAIHIMTDAAMTDVKSGKLAAIQSKQILLQSGIMIAGLGPWGPCRQFASLAQERVKSFDELIDVAEMLWKEARAVVPAGVADQSYALAFAGYSETRERLHLIVIESDPVAFPADQEAFAIWDTPAFMGGPIPIGKTDDFVTPFFERLEKSPDDFDPHRDGLEIMETLRTRYPFPYKDRSGVAVGGYVQLSTIRQGHITSEVIKHWPGDQIGKCIKPDSEPPLLWFPQLTEMIAQREWRDGVMRRGIAEIGLN